MLEPTGLTGAVKHPLISCFISLVISERWEIETSPSFAYTYTQFLVSIKCHFRSTYFSYSLILAAMTCVTGPVSKKTLANSIFRCFL